MPDSNFVPPRPHPVAICRSNIDLIYPCVFAVFYCHKHFSLDFTDISTMPGYFRITLVRSAIGLPAKTSGVLQALGLRKRMRTVYHPVSPQVAGQIFAVKELIDVQEVERPLSNEEMKALRRPEKGFWVEKKAKNIGIGV